MPRMKIADHLSLLISKLRGEYAELTSRLSELNAIFEKLGITAGHGGAAVGVAKARRGRPPKSAKAEKAPKASGGKRGRRTRGKFALTGEQSIIEFVKKEGKPNAAEVNAHWSKEGRAGKADNALGRLVKTGTLKRVKVADERGSRYAIA